MGPQLSGNRSRADQGRGCPKTPWSNTHPEEEAQGPWVLAACLQWKQQNSVGRLHLGWSTRTWAPHGSDVGRVEPGLVPLQALPSTHPALSFSL